MFSFVINVLSLVLSLVTSNAATASTQFDGKRSPLDPDLSASMQRLLALTITKFLCCCIRRRRPVAAPIHRRWNQVIVVPAPLTAFDADTKQLVAPAEGGETPGSSANASDHHDAAVLTTGMHALLFPCVLSAVTDLAFPFDLLGSVHESSAIRVVDVAGMREVLQTGVPCDVEVRWDPATDVAPHKRGSICTFTTRLSAKLSSTTASTLLWESQKRMLFFHKQGTQVAVDATKQDSSAPLPAVSAMTLPGNLGWSWARISRDYNPIHVNPIAAYVLGFKQGTIAHGMCVLHLALRGLPGSMFTGSEAGSWKSIEMSVQFTRPAFIPSKARCHAAAVDGLVSLEVQHATNGKSTLAANIRIQ